MKEGRLECGFDDPFGGVCFRGAFVGSGEGHLLAIAELKEQRIGDGPIDHLKHCLVELRRPERDLKDLNFGDAVPGGEIGCFRGEFVFPKNLADLGHEEFPDPL